jgi:osmoprotectant transport system ATP-binding protein
MKARHRREMKTAQQSGQRIMQHGGLSRATNDSNSVPGPVPIELLGVTKCFGSMVALERTDLVFEAGKTTILIGPSGCGKSTILRLIVGLLQPTTGLVRFDGRVLSPETILSLRRRMGYVIQEGGLFPHLTARQNVLLLANHLRLPHEETHARLAELCEMTRLAPVTLSRYPLELSGGQRQRVCLIRALMLRPDVLLLDEPLAALDPMVRATLQMELKAIFQQICQTVIFVTHDLAEAAWLGDRIVLLRQGSVVQSGTFATLLAQPAHEFVSEFISAQKKLALV